MLGFILLQTTLRQVRQRDGGPLYTETNLSQWIVEPWNDLSCFSYISGIFVYGLVTDHDPLPGSQYLFHCTVK